MAFELNHETASYSPHWGHLEVHLQEMGNGTGSLDGLLSAWAVPSADSPQWSPLSTCRYRCSACFSHCSLSPDMICCLLLLSEAKEDTWNKKESLNVNPLTVGTKNSHQSVYVCGGEAVIGTSA